MQMIGRESGPVFFFFLDFFAVAASVNKDLVTITSVSTTPQKDIQFVYSARNISYFWGLCHRTIALLV